MESEIRIPWKRRWVNETNITEDVSDSGLRRNDVEYEGRVFFKEGNELQDLSKIPFLLLFGSAGSGKTTSLEDLQHILADNVVLAFDLKVKSVKVVNEEINLALKSDESNQKGKITVLIDSLDEAMLTGDGKACRELGEYICSYPKERINIRIGTRPHPFNPELISKIRDKHGGDSVQAFRLLPLSQNDVSLAAKSYRVDPDSFLKTLYKK